MASMPSHWPLALLQVDKYVQKVLSETPAHVEEVIIEKARQQ